MSRVFQTSLSLREEGRDFAEFTVATLTGEIELVAEIVEAGGKIGEDETLLCGALVHDRYIGRWPRKAEGFLKFSV